MGDAREWLTPVGQWELCGERFYCRHQLHGMAWEHVNLQQMCVACAPFGGPIAMVRDESQAVALASSTAQPTVRICTAAGQLLSAFIWDKGRLAALGWTHAQELLLVQPDGQVHVHSMHGERLRQFSLGAECAKEGVVLCRTYGDGLVALTASSSLWAISGLAEPRPQRLVVPKLAALPVELAILEPRHTLSGCIEVLLAADSAVISADADAAQQVASAATPVTALAVSPNGQFVAALEAAGELRVWLADFSKCMSTFSLPADAGQPQRIAWCGTDGVLLQWEDHLLLVGPYGDTLALPLDTPGCQLVTECDGARIISAEQHDLLRRVPDPLVEVFSIGSTAPGAMLFDVRQLFNAREAKADAALRAIVASLPEAVSSCVEAAASDLDPPRQTALLKAACYGRAFCAANAYPRRRILEVCRLLRVLNALRMPAVGMPLTMAQLDALSPSGLIDRLVHARQHLLALRIAEALQLSTDGVLTHWACECISAGGSALDSALHETVAQRLAGRAGIRWSAVAAHAQALGRRPLAAMLLEGEARAADQVPLLVSLGEWERAFAKAALSGDTDLVYFVLFRAYHDESRWPRPKFLDLLATQPLARTLFTLYTAQQGPEQLVQLQLEMRQPAKAGQAHLQAAAQRVADLAELGAAGAGPRAAASGVELDRMQVLQALTDAATQYAQSKDHQWQSRGCSEWARLRRLQADLEQETGHACFLGRSMAQTVDQCIRLQNQRAAAKVRAEFKLSERRWAWIRARALASAQDWDGYAALAAERKLPVPPDALVAMARAKGAPKPVLARLIARLPDASRRAEELASIGLLQEAAEAAAQGADSAMLTRIQSMVNVGSPLGAAVASLKDRLAAAGSSARQQ